MYALSETSPSPRAGHSLTILPSKHKELLVIGGYTGEQRLCDFWKMNEIDLENATFQWQEEKYKENGSARFSDRAGHVVCNNPTNPLQLYIFGGYDSQRRVLDDLWKLDSNTKSLDAIPTCLKKEDKTTKSTWSVARRWASGDAIDQTHLLIAYGWDKAGPKNDILLFNTQSSEWSTLPLLSTSLPQGRRWHSTTWNQSQQQIFFFGGYVGENLPPLNDLWILDPHTGKISAVKSTPSTPSARCRHTANLIGKQLVVVGGLDEKGNALKGVNIFHTDDHKWEKYPAPEYYQTQRAGHSAVVFDENTLLIHGGLDKHQLDDVFSIDVRKIK